MERYLRVARKGTRTDKPYVWLTAQEFSNALWVEANDRAWEDMNNMPYADNDTVQEAQENRCDVWIDALKAQSYGIRIKEGYVYGGVLIGDYTYYTLTEDTITESEIERSN